MLGSTLHGNVLFYGIINKVLTISMREPKYALRARQLAKQQTRQSMRVKLETQG
jgi:hypothetical protein